MPSSPTDRHALLSIYLNDHFAGAAAGLALARRLARNHSVTLSAPDLWGIAAQIEQDRNTLRAIMIRLHVRRSPWKPALAVAGERLSRLKLNGRIRGRSPLSTLVELEAMLLGVQGKISGWRALQEVSDDMPGLSTDQLERLMARARRQTDRLEALRVSAVRHALGPPTAAATSRD